MRNLFRRFGAVAAFAALIAALWLTACAGAPSERAAVPAESADAVSAASDTVAEAAPAADDLDINVESGRALVVYFAQGTAARRTAEDLAGLLGADLERIVETKPRTLGFFGYMAAGYQATFGLASAITAPAKDPADYDVVVVVTPVWSWNLSPPVRAWLRLIKGRLPVTAGYVTVSGETDPDRIVASMAQEAGMPAKAFVGFGEADYRAENRTGYLAKLTAFMTELRR